MNSEQLDAIKETVSECFRGRVDVAWDGEPEAFAAWGLVARINITSDVERNGGGFELRRVEERGKLREEVWQRRDALVTILLEARNPGEDPPTAQLAARLLRRENVARLAAAGLYVTATNTIRPGDFRSDSRILQSGVVEMRINYTEVDEGHDTEGLDWIESATPTGTVA